MIKLLRLVSGEELLAEVKDYPDSVEILDSLVLIPAGEGKIGIMPYMPYTDAHKGLTIPKSFIMFMADPVEDLKRQFTAARSGLALPNNGSILV